MEMDVHRSRLPGWNRPDLGVRGTLLRDRETPVPQVSRIAGRIRTRILPPLRLQTLQFASPSSKRRKRKSAKTKQEAQRLDRNIAFLRQQHLETLQQLHQEAERLKKENRGSCICPMNVHVLV